MSDSFGKSAAVEECESQQIAIYQSEDGFAQVEVNVVDETVGCHKHKCALYSIKISARFPSIFATFLRKANSWNRQLSGNSGQLPPMASHSQYSHALSRANALKHHRKSDS
ncbi:hypothetical protein GO003_017810 [Methylicorpusculum oleiharenae]|uniref:hypothetical protein n=1 Tax=Methylicorpusculum oleiharenae TaxID=1338687 RepID=UPI001357BECC|nr:hypothetical protein [Methylicorpusculum oleiharenae]MCD2452248.1 hypothetical protein [Methylicorpusculum oleiharenae]